MGEVDEVDERRAAAGAGRRGRPDAAAGEEVRSSRAPAGPKGPRPGAAAVEEGHSSIQD